jgi:hypothetical protein
MRSSRVFRRRLVNEFWRLKSGDGRRRRSAQALRHLSAQAPKLLRRERSAQGTAKSRHPEFEPVKVYLRQATHRAARRKFEDSGEGDFSDLVERLLQKYLGA